MRVRCWVGRWGFKIDEVFGLRGNRFLSKFLLNVECFIYGFRRSGENSVVWEFIYLVYRELVCVSD